MQLYHMVHTPLLPTLPQSLCYSTNHYMVPHLGYDTTLHQFCPFDISLPSAPSRLQP